MPKVSVIVPVYKVESILNNCIDSIINQTYKDFELILVDDGSPDNSGKICDMYAKKDNRIKVIHKENGGVSSARNAGVDCANGKYICFVDSDDYVANDYIECLVDTKEKYPNFKNVWCSFFVLSNNSENTRINSYDENNSDKVIIVSRNQFMTLHEKWLDPMPWNKLYEIEIIKSNNIKMDEKLSLGEDLIFNLEYLHFSDSDDILIINKPLVYYRVGNENSLDNKYYPNLFEIYKRLESELLFYGKKWNLSLDQIKKIYSASFYKYEVVLNNTFNTLNKASYFQKVRYNNKILKSKEFVEALNKMDAKINKFYRVAYKSKNYLFVNLLNKLVQQKAKIY